ncbi:hypothetical protein GQ44DRAFT_778739 [Phaeosphaeriaceae sp. PMI808]|nr:hypothetical protein GQ44DRAFT_778739 [Phaeosphaeriaceae sp. PMI808]
MSTNPAEAYAEKTRREQEANPITIDRLDDNVIAKLPAGSEVVTIVPAGASAWCKTFRIDAKLKDGELKSYFMKYESGELGRRMMEGAFQSDSAYSTYALENMPRPVGSSEFKDELDTWFYISEFHDMVNKLPEVSDLVNIVAKVHKASMGKSPTGKHMGKAFIQLMQSMYQFEKSTQGVDKELDILFDALYKKAIPRLLRSLETNGRSIEPCLIHSDLWPGNCMPDADTGLRPLSGRD